MRYLVIFGLILAVISVWNQNERRKEEELLRMETIALNLDKYERVSVGTSTIVSSVPLDGINSL